MIPVRVRAHDAHAGWSLTGKLDSGADLCGLPRDLLERASLPPLRAVRATGFTGDVTEVLLYRVDIEIDGAWIDGVECIATRRPYVIVGRNALAAFVLRLDGPRERLDLRR
jgi:predicted aspartyl protease